jgi:hypothetical protein
MRLSEPIELLWGYGAMGYGELWGAVELQAAELWG